MSKNQLTLYLPSNKFQVKWFRKEAHVSEVVIIVDFMVKMELKLFWAILPLKHKLPTIYLRFCNKQIQIPIAGSGCDSVGRAVTSDSRGPQFKSSHRQILY